jgi:hypothetical protein
VVTPAAEYLLENAVFYAKNQKRFEGSDTTFFQVEGKWKKKSLSV